MKKISLSFFLLFTAYLLPQTSLLCQSTQWVNFNTSNSGLPNNSLYAAAVDKQGVKWFGTDGGGLVKFDGVKWTIYNTENSPLTCNFMRVIYVDEENNKWIGTKCGGLFKFDGTNWTNWNPANSILPSLWVASITVDRNGVKWIGTGDKGLVSIDGDKLTLYTASNSPLPVDYIYALAADTLGNVWIGTNGGGTARFDGTTWKIYNKYNSGLHCNASLAIAIDNQNDRWVGSYTCGIFKQHDTTWTMYDKNTSQIPSNWVYSVIIDNQQAKWIGLDSAGVAKFQGSKWTTYDTANSGLADKHVRAIAIDDLGNKWIATYLGGISVFNENGVNISPVIIVSQPGHGANWIAGSKQRITWGTSNVPGNVNIKLSTDGGSSFPVTLISNTQNDGAENIIVPNTPSSSCMIRIESIADPKITGISSGKFNIVAMSVPLQISPLNGASRQPLDVKLNWSKGEWCEKYKLIFASDSLFAHPLIQDASLTDTLRDISGLVDFRTYYWKIQGINNDVSTEWSPVWNFTTIFNSPDSLKAFPEGKDKTKLQWRDNSVSETGYIVERKSDAVFIVVDTAAANSTAYIDSGLIVPGNYQYRIKAIAKGGESDYSNTASVIITSVENSVPVITDFVLEQNYPNPFNPATTIRYSLPEQSDVELTIYNIKGMVIKTFIFNSQSAGYQHVVWNGRTSLNVQAASGTYICKLKAVTAAGKSVERTVKMILIK